MRKVRCRDCKYCFNVKKNDAERGKFMNECETAGAFFFTDTPWECGSFRKKEDNMSLPLIEQSQAYHGAFDWFNEKLFDGLLPRPMLCLTRNANVVGGYFNKDKWHDEKGNGIHEIAINANMMEQGNVVELMHTLIHEMLHLKQECVGKPSRHGYHNSEYATWAEWTGLECKDLKTGNRTGHMVATRILDGGRAAKAIALLPDEHIFPWMAVRTGEDGKEGGGGGSGTGEGSGGEGRGGDSSEPPRRSGSRSKFTCAICGLNAWAKPGAKLVCGECDKALVETK